MTFCVQDRWAPIQSPPFVNRKEPALGVLWRPIVPTSKVLGKLTPSQELYYPHLCREGPKHCLKTLPTLIFFEDKGAGTFTGVAPGRVWSKPSHLEDGRRLSIEVQDWLRLVHPALSCLEVVADLDSDVGEAVLLTQLHSHQGMQGWSWMWGRR